MKHYISLLAMALVLGFSATSASAQSKIDKKNLVVKEWKTDVRTSIKILDHTTTYNADGQKIEEVEYGVNGQKWRKRYEYGTNGKVSRELVYDDRNRLTAVKKYEYNEYGRRKTMQTFNGKGKLTSVKTYEYVYSK